MPAPERHRSKQPDPDLSAIPSFLRDAPARSRIAIPRPVTPPGATQPPTPAPSLDPASLPMPSLSRRRVVTAAGVLLAGLLVLSFARQVSEATAASNRAAELRLANAALRDDVDRLQRDLDHVQDVRFIRLEGRAYGLGGPREIPFALAAGAPPLAADAPGSASVRLGAVQRPQSPIDAWLEVLFGPGR